LAFRCGLITVPLKPSTFFLPRIAPVCKNENLQDREKGMGAYGGGGYSSVGLSRPT
jgi:hypothetical protein